MKKTEKESERSGASNEVQTTTEPETDKGRSKGI
jgi:hypothetical protein